MKIEGDKIIFSTGKNREVSRMIGLSPDMRVWQGDDYLFWSSEDDEEFLKPKHRLGKEEMAELADHMIEQWQKFRSLMLEK